MSPNLEQFTRSDGAEPHKARTKAILARHPEVRRHIGKNPWSIVVIVALVAAQLTLAFVLRDAPWWAILPVAYFVGAIIDHALFVLIHECAHNLIFKRTVPNTLAGILANLPSVLPSSVSFKRYHLKHHSYQGVYELDADIPSVWEAKLIGNSPFRKAMWLLLFPLFQVLRPFRIRAMSLMDRWVVLNMVVVIAVDVLVVVFLGPAALLYLVAAVFFSVGLHPVGARWIQRHWLVDDEQETYSYYGLMNALAFNVGYHNEHHDFPSVPWNRLPRLRDAAPEYYAELMSHTSWTRLLFKFVFDRRLSLFSRMVRDAARMAPAELRSASRQVLDAATGALDPTPAAEPRPRA